MRKRFIESPGFSRWLAEHLSDAAYAAFQRQLMAAPDAGKVIRGCGGLRKIRIGDPRRGQGKRGGARVIYLHVPEVDWVFLVDVYGKDEKGDLTPGERKTLAELAARFRSEALASKKREP